MFQTATRPRVRGDDERPSRDSIPPEFCNFVRVLLKKKRAQGKPGARRTRGLMCPCASKEMLHMSIQVRREHPGLPCAMALRRIRALPGDPAFLSPSSGGPYRRLDANPGASGPHDFTVRGCPYVSAFAPEAPAS